MDKTIRHDLLRFSKYDYTYKLKYNSETLENFQCIRVTLKLVSVTIFTKLSKS